ncbi:ketopantoate reductase family protein [Streptomyces sp. NPDC058257]|uniref:ketopantoate reductase family protein n=1 Tax=Streptomyces sp. NPDC058257 TaxID=3346409 RepID=UPI0036E85C9B
MKRPMKVLVIGAGALGQVFGLWLARGGASVTYLVRPGREGWEREGRTLFRLRRLGGPVAERLRPAAVVADLEDLNGEGGWDAVWLCVSSTDLHGPWVQDLRDRVGSATVVPVIAAPHTLSDLTRIWPAEQIVQVVPSVLAYQAPLTDEVPSPGIAYWMPPGAAITVSGAEDRAGDTVAALRAGSVRARKADREGAAEQNEALMIPYMAALEVADWSLPALRKKLSAPTAAAREAAVVAAALTDSEPPATAVPAWAIGLAMRALPVLAPFDLPRYLRAHWTKVGPQTREMLDEWITEGRSRGQPVRRLEELREALTARA